MLLEVKGVEKRFKSLDVLKGISLSVNTGDAAVILGPSGAGKSTLLNVLSGLECVTEGEVLYSGTSLYKLKERELSDIRLKEFGFVFQAFHLIPNLNVQDNILLPALTAYGKAEKEWFSYLVEKLQINHRMNHTPGQLSGGECQRVAIARALINKPEVLFADEPSGNLDTQNGQAVFDLLFDYANENGKTLIYVTHDLEKADLAKRKISIKDGAIC